MRINDLMIYFNGNFELSSHSQAMSFEAVTHLFLNNDIHEVRH